MNITNETEKQLAAGVIRWMESGDPTLSCDYMLKLTSNDVQLLELILEKWYLKGYIVWKRCVSDLNPSDMLVRFGRFPLSNVLWPPPLSIEPMEQTITVDLYNDGRFIGKYPCRQKALIEKYLPDAKITSENANISGS